MRELPPLHSLRAFEATARLGGVYRAGEELCVTHGAISRQIKQLEAYLGTVLFDRKQRNLVLNKAGERYLSSVGTALDLLEQASLATRRERPVQTLQLSTTHSLASKWLIDKLSPFKARSGIDVWLSLEQNCIDFSAGDADLALRMGSGPWPGLHCIPLLKDQLIAVASPALLTQPLQCPSELSTLPLLHDSDPNCQWLRLFEHCKLPPIALQHGPRLNSTDILLKSAVAGQGIALVSERLARDDLEHGHLHRALTQHVPLGDYLWLVMPQHKRQQASVRALCDFLIQCADEENHEAF